MNNKNFQHFTKVEMEFMQILWDHGEQSPEDIRRILKENGRVLTNGGTRRILSILCRKGHITRRKEGRSYVYNPNVKKQQAFKDILIDLRKRVFGDSGIIMIAAFLDSFHASDDEFKEIKRLLENYKKDRDK
ncbi:BlaI/MecI/CopY family transcriptional regulator [bacterium]|nr:BlaI/MecI/CopY family transcriptional regulator [bacterium]